jgi:hypothetical protein
MKNELLKSTSIALALSVIAAGTAFAQNTKDTAQRMQTQSSNATRGSNTPEAASRGARGGFDTRSTTPPPVRATAAPKPSPVGLPVTSTASQQGFKPRQPSLHTAKVPTPTAQKNPSWNPKGDPAVARGYQRHQSVNNPRINPQRDPAVAKGYSNNVKPNTSAPSYRAASAAPPRPVTASAPARPATSSAPVRPATVSAAPARSAPAASSKKP